MSTQAGLGPQATARGFTLGSTLLLIGIAMSVAFALTALAFFQMNVHSQAHALLLAQNAAESAIQMAIGQELSGSIAFGKRSTDRVQFQDGNGAVGIVTFVAGEKYNDVPLDLSTYNYDPTGAQSTAQGYGGRLVPRDGIHLVGNGFWGGAARHVECVLYFPNYPYAVGANGTLHVSNALIAAATKNTAGLTYNADGTVSIDESNFSQANIVCNSGSSQAMVVDANTKVTGDAQAVGTVTLQQAQVLGEVRSNADPIAIPVLTPGPYDPSTNQFCQVLPPSVDSPTVGGYAVTQGDLTVQGNVALDNGLLFVKGNLTVNGGLQGNGAVVVAGATTIRGSATVTGSQGLALFSNGDVSLLGNGKDSSFLQGLFYTNGNMDVAHLTVLGTVIQNQQTGSNGATHIVDARIVFDPGKSVVSVFRPYTALTSNQNPPSGEDFANWLARTFTDLTVNPPKLPAPITPIMSAPPIPVTQRVLNLPPANYTACLWEDGSPILTGKDDITKWCFCDYNLTASLRDMGGGDYHLILMHCQQGRGEGGGHGYDGNSMMDRSLLPNSPWANYPTDNHIRPAGFLSIQEMLGPSVNADGSVDPVALSNFIDAYVNGRALNIQYMDQAFGWSLTTTSLRQTVDTLIRQALRRPSNKVPPRCNFQYDPNQYLSPAERMRVLLWRDIE